MTRRHEQIIHRRKLSEIRNIMNSMKTLAIMETHKLERFIETQSAMAITIENMAADFLHFNPQVLPVVEPGSNIIILIGSERVFCGDFNEKLITQLELSFTDPTKNNTTIIAVGNKLHSLLDEIQHKVIYIEGANVVEEISSVVDSLAKILAESKQTISLDVLYHCNNQSELVIEKLLPPFKDMLNKKVNYSNPPLLNLTNQEFFLDLTEHYLFNSLHRIMYVSLMIENQHRTQHLENATQHLDNKTDELKHKINALRQEEIIEEIEIILLNA